MSNYYALVSALTFALVALVHVVRLKRMGGADRATFLYPCLYRGLALRCYPDRNLGLHALG